MGLYAEQRHDASTTQSNRKMKTTLHRNLPIRGTGRVTCFLGRDTAVPWREEEGGGLSDRPPSRAPALRSLPLPGTTRPSTRPPGSMYLDEAGTRTAAPAPPCFGTSSRPRVDMRRFSLPSTN